MKKTFLKILLCLTAVALLCVSLTGCAKSNWDKSDVTLKDWGAVVEANNGSFVAETANYVYYINGIGDAEEDNTFGMPIRGALMAADKSDFTKKCVVVPKLFVAEDYKAGVYIFGDYVYYGSPSVNKNSSGEIAKDELFFSRTKLDGTVTDNYFSVSGLDTEYRIVKTGDDVYIVYYDSAASALKVYNTTNRKAEIICKTDVKAEARSLSEYKFVDNSDANNAVLLYTVTVYSEAYNAKDAENSSYSRPTYSYNELYVYKAGDVTEGECKGVKVFDGNTVPAKTYSVVRLSNELVFFKTTEATATSEAKYYASTVADLYAKNEGAITEITDTTYVVGESDADISANNLIINLNKVYAYVGNTIKVSTITGNVIEEEKTLAKDITANE
ncbi:MAG: hypothetical protein J6Y43_03180 [Clostridia bacterium]|nr:hypothetical protein [Clostridia bacterium]